MSFCNRNFTIRVSNFKNRPTANIIPRKLLNQLKLQIAWRRHGNLTKLKHVPNSSLILHLIDGPTHRLPHTQHIWIWCPDKWVLDASNLANSENNLRYSRAFPWHYATRRYHLRIIAPLPPQNSRIYTFVPYLCTSGLAHAVHPPSGYSHSLAMPGAFE